MKKENVLLIKNFVDSNCDEDKKSDTAKNVALFKEILEKLEEDDFVEVMISSFIPDTYNENGKREKLYTKLVETIVGEWWRRLGGTYNLPTKKSGTEDVELISQNNSIVCDAKAFRLGRSQKAPNVKDFLKLASVDKWITNLVNRYKKDGKKQNVLGGLVTYSSLHEWEGESEVYQECSDKGTPVVMLPYEILAVLLKNKDKFTLDQLLTLWNYNEHFPTTVKTKQEYWKKMDSLLINLLSIKKEQYYKEINAYRAKIMESVKVFVELINDEVERNKAEIMSELESFDDIEDLRKYALERIESFTNRRNYEFLGRIKNFRSY